MFTRAKNESVIGMYDKESFYFLSTPWDINFFTKQWKITLETLSTNLILKKYMKISNLSKAASWLIRCMSYAVKCFDPSQ